MSTFTLDADFWADFDPGANGVAEVNEEMRQEARRLSAAANELLYEGRYLEDPEDQWSGRLPEMDDERLAAAREATIQYVEHDFPDYGARIRRGGYTCDDCGYRRKCPLVFDSYNTNGDCLLEK